MLQAGIESRQALRQPDNTTSQPPTIPTQAGKFNKFNVLNIAIRIHFTLTEIRVLISLEELCINPPQKRAVTQGQYFSQLDQVINSVFSFSLTKWHTKDNETVWPTIYS